jgi:hypothetical protein
MPSTKSRRRVLFVPRRLPVERPRARRDGVRCRGRRRTHQPRAHARAPAPATHAAGHARHRRAGARRGLARAVPRRDCRGPRRVRRVRLFQGAPREGVRCVLCASARRFVRARV